MVLANLNIENCLVEQIKNYITSAHWSFTELKTLILNRKAIIEIQIKMDALLFKAEELAITKAKQNLKIEMYSIFLALNAHSPHPSLVIIFIVASVMSALTGIHRPAFESMTQQLVKPADYKAVGALSSLAGRVDQSPDRLPI